MSILLMLALLLNIVPYFPVYKSIPCISRPIFPSLLKIVKVIPIHKDGSTKDMMHKRLIHLWKKVIFYITNNLGLAKETQPQMH